MAERATRWTDELLPFRRVRQWVLTVPWPRRRHFAGHHDLAKAVLRDAIAVLQDHYRQRAGGGQSGFITVVQRFGSALHLNVHFHILALDGTFSLEGADDSYRPEVRRRI